MKDFLLLAVAALLLVSHHDSIAATKAWDQFVAAKINGNEPAITDFSYAGYHYGEKGIPDVKHKVFNVLNYGALANDEKSDQRAIQKAIDAAKSHGSGIVYFPPGRYVVNTSSDSRKPLKINSSNIVLRGAGSGPGGTEIFMKNSLTPGGMIRYMFEFTGRSAEKTLATIIGDADRDAFWIEVSNSNSLKVGQRVTLSVKNKSALRRYVEPYKSNSSWTWGLQVREHHQVAEINGNWIRLKEPLHIDVKASDKWSVLSYPTIKEVGVEDIRFVGNWKKKFVHHRSVEDDGGWSAVRFDNVVNSWIRRCVFHNWNQGVYFWESSASSALKLEFTGTKGHHNVRTLGGYGVLFGYIEDKAKHHHGPSVGWRSAGIVFWRMKYDRNGGWDAHAGTPYATLLDSVSGGMRMDRNGGARSTFPNHLHQFVLWNFENVGSTTNNIDFWPGSGRPYLLKPIVVGLNGNKATFVENKLARIESQGKRVEPNSLYEAQLKLRLGRLPKWVTDLQNGSMNPSDPNVKSAITPPRGLSVKISANR